MAIRCQIKVYKTAADALRPGSIVSGILKYDIDEETVCNKITVSFKGNGHLLVKLKKRESNISTFRKTEEYTQIDYIIYRDEAGAKLPAGSYKTEFHFILPENIPPSLRYTKKTVNHFIHCYITYYISIKFEKSGILKGITKFKRPVKVISIAIPKLPTEPTVYGQQQTLKRQFSRTPSVLKLTATIISSVIIPGEKIRIEYEVNNDTHVNVKAVVVKMIELYTIKGKGGKEIKFVEPLNNTMKVSGYIKMRETKNRIVEVPVPLDLGSLDHSNLVSREYFVHMTLELPLKYEDMVLKIPVQIGDENLDMESNRLPPSYWDVLQEDGIDNRFDDRLNLSEVDESETEL